MNDTDPQHPDCFPCRRGRHAGCLWQLRPTGCDCPCPWLAADMLAHFPSLRRVVLQENQVTTAQHVVDVAQHEVGYVEGGGSDGRSGNITKFWQELDPGLQGQPWCACFVRWTDKHAGGPLLPVSNPYYCPSLVTYGRLHGLWSPDSGEPGDYVLYDFNGHGVAEHIGRLRKPWRRGQNDAAVEGNTSSDSFGSQANGGGVYDKERTSSLILGCLRYSTLLTADGHKPKPAPRNPEKRNPNPAPTGTVKRGATGPSVQWVQWAAGVPVDGTFGAQTDHAVRLFQHYHGLVVDGVVGPATRAALARVTH